MHNIVSSRRSKSIINDDRATGVLHYHYLRARFGNLNLLQRLPNVIGMRSLETLRLNLDNGISIGGGLAVLLAGSIRLNGLHLLRFPWNLRRIRECGFDGLLVGVKVPALVSHQYVSLLGSGTNPSWILMTMLTNVSSSSSSMMVKNESFWIPVS